MAESDKLGEVRLGPTESERDIRIALDEIVTKLNEVIRKLNELLA